VSFFVTGTDTGVGKTHTIVQLLRFLRLRGKSCAGFKPICCGDRKDAERLLEASASGLRIEDVNPLWLKTPAAPLMAAQIEGVKIDIQRLIGAFQALRRVEVILVEGVGGWMVPIMADYFVSDLAADLKLPVVIVAQNRLGCLNHILLTVRSVQAAGLRCAGVILNHPNGAEHGVASATNSDILAGILDVPLLPELVATTAELPVEWAQILGLPTRRACNPKRH
jgi:dethiobiotin synthetase